MNRALWAIMNERFTDAAAEERWTRSDIVWGLFATPEGDLDVLRSVQDLDVAELACGTAYFSAWLTRAGANTVAVDLNAVVDGQWQRLTTATGDVVKKEFFSLDPRMLELVSHMSDEEIARLRRGGLALARG